jgi:uncharacterized OsmC-like protein
MGYNVRVERTDDGTFVATNERGGTLAFGGGDQTFSPVELMLVALGGCNIITVEPLTAQRGHRMVRLAAVVQAQKVAVNRLGPITFTWDVELPPGDEQAAQVFHDVAHRVHDRHCAVSTTFQEPTQIDVTIAE